MDNEIRHRLEELVRAIGESEEYRTYEEARQRLDLEPEKKKRVILVMVIILKLLPKKQKYFQLYQRK